MRSEARLDSAVFQLTPTRTRCDLVIIANGKSEKIASGLLNPFLNHLKAAQDQISKGGYSITLEPDANSDASWFTKGTVERFVRFVSTPEIVERVTTIESEILQIENAIEIQNNEKVEGQIAKAAEGTEGNKASADDDAAKAIVPYKPGSQPNAPDSNSNGPTVPEENSKVQLLRVLETRKVVLQKEQAMAFARAAAAGFDMDDMAPLISFAESFGASRLKEACMRFMDLWKQKHETGQWIEVEALSESGFSYMNGSGIMLAADSLKQKELGEAWQASIGDITSENGKGEMPSDGKVPEHIPGQMQHPMYSQWPLYPPSGPPPVFPSYPGMPYYNYPGSVPYFHPPYPPPSDDPRFSAPRSRKKGSKKHSMDARDSNNESEVWDQSPGSQEGTDEDISDFEKESSHSRPSHKKGGRSGKKKPGVVVIKNLNYIAKKFGAGSDSQSGSGSETEEENEEIHSSSRERKHKRSSKTSKKEESKNRSFESSIAYNEREENSEPQAESDNWQVFQNFLLKAEEKPRPVGEDMFSGESALPVKGKKIINEVDPLVPNDRVNEDDHVQRIIELDSANGAARRMKQGASNDEILILNEGGISEGDQFKEIQGGEGAYRKMASDEFVIYGNQEQSSNRYSSDPLTGHVNENATKVEKDSSSYNVSDESFMLPYRSASPDHLEQSNRVAIEMDSEYPVAPIKAEDSPKKDNADYSYEPDDFYLMPDREIDNASSNYDPAFEYDMQIPTENSISTEVVDKEEEPVIITEEAKKPEKDKKQSSLEKRRKDALVKRGPPSRLNPLAEAQKRAEKLRTYKADLQKMKKEQEEEKLKRLEALKLERQKRIASRSGSIQSPVAAQNKSRISTKPSPSPLKGSKFSDSESRLSLPLRTNSTGSNDSVTKSSKSNETSNGLTRSASSLTDVKRESNGLLSGPRATSQRINRLAEPKVIPKQPASSLKSASKNQVPKKAAEQSRTKITEIMQLDEKKSATLPELKIRTSKGHPDTGLNSSPAKDALQKESEVEVSQPSDNIHGERETDSKTSSQRYYEDNQVVEKSVVMLENRLVSAPLAQPTKGIINNNETSHENGSVPDYAGSHDSPVQVMESSEENRDDHMNSYEVAAAQSSEVENPKSNVEKSSEASHVRAVTFMEEPHRTNVESEAATISASEIVATYSESFRVQPSRLEDLSSVETHETSEKPRSKEAKGFRKLLKFGRKTHNGASSDGNNDSDASSVDDNAISNDAHQLKNLISQDDTHPEGTPAKVSRPFSLLSPFRSKHSEKKIAA